MPQPVVSVIIPVYNTERYLRECLDSVVNQTLREIEIICINDGSTDGSPAILKEYAAADERIRLISQKNRGLSAARNRGMECARGTYLFFLDSDDYLEPAALEKLTETAQKHNLEILRFESENIYESERLYELFHVEQKRAEEAIGVCTGVEYLGIMKDAKMYRSPVWLALWRRAFLEENRLAFREGFLFEDVLFTFQALFCAKRVMHLPDLFHHYRIRANSIVTSPNRSKRVVSFFGSAEEVLMEALQGNYSPAEERELCRAFSAMILNAAFYYARLSKESRAKLTFPRAIEKELFKQTVIPAARVKKLKEKLEKQTETIKELRVKNDQKQREIEALQEKLRQLEDAVGTLIIQQRVNAEEGRTEGFFPETLSGGDHDD